jgi:uncharacterized glyoxalase superfamily protein PhnB
MEFGYTILHVDDVQKSVEFYEQAFGLKRRFIHEGGQYAEMETGSTALAFASNELAATNLPDGFRRNSISEKPAGIEIALLSTDLEAAHAHAINCGAKEVVAPKRKPWGQTVAYVRDLDGVLVELASPLGSGDSSS